MSRMRALRRGMIVRLRMNGGDHPYVALTDPVNFPGKGRGKIIMVPLTTSESYAEDPGYVLITVRDEGVAAGSHAIYPNAELKDAAEVKDDIRKHRRRFGMVEAGTLRFLCGEFLKSDEVSNGMKGRFLYAKRKGKAG